MRFPPPPPPPPQKKKRWRGARQPEFLHALPYSYTHKRKKEKKRRKKKKKKEEEEEEKRNLLCDYLSVFFFLCLFFLLAPSSVDNLICGTDWVLSCDNLGICDFAGAFL